MPVTQTVKLNADSVTIDLAALEALKSAMLAFFSEPDGFPPKHEQVREYFRRELEVGACWMDEKVADIGVWRLVNDDEQVTLVRHPELGTPAPTYHARVDRKDARWVVVGLDRERHLPI